MENTLDRIKNTSSTQEETNSKHKYTEIENYSKRNIQRKLGEKMNKPSVKNCRITSGSAKYVKLGSRKLQREKEGQLRKMAKKSNGPKCP